MPDHALPARRPRLNFRARGACARSAEAAGLSLGKPMIEGVLEISKKHWHQPPSERNELPGMACFLPQVDVS